MNSPEPLPKRVPPPLKQRNLERATELAVEALAGQSDDQMRWLGAEPLGDRWCLPVLGQSLEADVVQGSVVTAAGIPVGPQWRILVLHYLGLSSKPQPRQPAVTFADLATARSYAGVYHGRVIARLCATAGRTAETLLAAAADLTAEAVAGGDASFDFRVFPRLTVRLVWHAPDEEFPASATLLLPDNIEDYFPAEDIVVLSESLVARLGGRPF